MHHTYVYLHIQKARERKTWKNTVYVRDFLLTCLLAPALSFCPHLNALEHARRTADAYPLPLHPCQLIP